MRGFQSLVRVGRCALCAVVSAGFVPVTGANDSGSAKPPLNVFAGRVVDHQGKPVASAKVAVVDPERGFIAYHGPNDISVFGRDDKILLFFTRRNGRRSAETTTDADGRFEIKGLREGQYHLLAVHAERGVAIESNVAQPNTASPIEVVLQPPTFVRGTIRGWADAEKTHGGFLTPFVESALRRKTPALDRIFVSQRIEIGQDGTFQVGPLPVGGHWALEISEYNRKRNFSATLLSRPVVVTMGKTNLLTIDLTKGSTLSGRVRGPDGAGLDEASVTVAMTDAQGSTTTYGAITGKDGTYTIRGLPDGQYRLVAKRWAPRTGFG